MTAQYDGFADAYEAHAGDSAYNAHYDRPTVLALCGDVHGQRVLDAGCGPGFVAEALLAAGAGTVEGFDQSGDMIEVARRRLGGRAVLRRHDLEDPLSWLPDGCVDLVVSSLVMHYVDGRVAALAEFARVLAPGGRVVMSTTHPVADWLYIVRRGGEDDYFTPCWVDDTWACGLATRWWHQPLEAWFGDIRDAGLRVDRFVETRPAPSMATAHPDEHEKLSRKPAFVAFRLVPA